MILIGATGKASHISTLDPAPAPLHPYSIASQQAQTSVQERHDQGTNSKDVSNLHAANTVNSRTTPTTNLLICTPITLFNPESLRRIHTTAFFDCGASITMIKKQIATELNLNIEEEQPLSLQTFGNDEDQIHPSSRTNVGLVLENDDSTMLKVRTLSFLSQPMQMGLARDHIRGDMPACSTTTQPETSKRIRSRPHQTRKYQKRKYRKRLHTHQFAMALSCIDTLENPIQHHKLEELVQKFCPLESVGIIDDVSQSDDEICLQKFNDTIYFSPEEGYVVYMVRLPLKEDTSLLSDNFNMAMSRLKSTVNTFKKHYGLLDKYHNIIKDQLQKGIIEEVK
ncbi:hypothetical protein NECAME_17306 [Necator americanus]|uniref:DUF1758 domain-containing protein n=1 Tax=Necator americanus TaxID=51031 RepID=W2TQA2_NECAM|nr:hypothetical protein NECAME_17306 [Necator americanus]ETN83983.1 hypothetical protein NECAME_17306 [Necator americanus]